MKLVELAWDVYANTLCFSVLALRYSISKYYVPVWVRSTHSNQADVQTNTNMHMITGTIRPTLTLAACPLQHRTTSTSSADCGD